MKATSERDLRSVWSLLTALLIAMALGGVLALHAAAATLNFTPPSPPFHQCPGMGADTSCGALIWFSAVGQPRVMVDKSQRPYDGGDDTLVGVQNDAAFTLRSAALSSPAGIFNFDGDGACSGYYNALGCPFGNTGYEGPHTAFTVSNSNHGTVLFAPGVAPGGHAWFTLEDALTAVGSFTVVDVAGTSSSGIPVMSKPFPIYGSPADQTLTAADERANAIAQQLIGLIFPPAGVASDFRTLASDIAHIHTRCKSGVTYDETACTNARKKFVIDDGYTVVDITTAHYGTGLAKLVDLLTTSARIQQIAAGNY